jgi:hypothetical protein
MLRYILLACVLLFIGFTIVFCKRSKLPRYFKPQIITSNLISDVETKTGVELPKTCRFILSSNSVRLDSDIWLFEIESNNPARFPRQLDLQPISDGRNMAQMMERMSCIPIGTPKAWYYGIWQTSNAQCHASLIVASNSDYLMLERLY